jgi:hypothetical protein
MGIGLHKLLVGKPEEGMTLERWDWVVWTGLVWLRIGTGGELL